MRKQLKYDFVLITPGRSGSEHLSQTLNNYPDIMMEGEVFNRNHSGYDSFNHYLNTSWWLRTMAFFFNREKLSRLRLNLPLRYLVYSFMLSEQSQISKGFKLTLDQLEAYPMVLNILLKEGCKIIYLNRENRLAQVLSLLRARQTGEYHTRSVNTDDQKFVFDKEQVKQHYERIKKWEITLYGRLNRIPHITLSYEELFLNYEERIAQLRQFLELPSASGYQLSALVKTGNKELDSWVSNLEEIKQYLKD